MFLYAFERDNWAELTDGIIAYLESNPTTVNHTWVEPVLSSSGRLGFTNDTVFTLPLHPGLEDNQSQTYDLGKSLLTISFFKSDSLPAEYSALDADPGSEADYNVYELIMDNGFRFVGVRHCSRQWYESDLKSVAFNTSVAALPASGLRISGPLEINLFASQKWDNDGYVQRCAFMDGSVPYRITQGSNGKYGFYGVFSGGKYGDYDFDTYADAVLWCCENSGFAVKLNVGGTVKDTSDDLDDYTPHAADVPITGDPAAARSRAADLARSVDVPNTDADTIDIAIPTTDTLLQAAEANPAILTDLTAAAAASIPVKPADLPDIDTAPELWTTKFPFCLPFDIARLITDFSAPAQIPKMSFIILPANSFGMHNEEITVEIDFEPYDKFIRISRFFLSLGFVFFLIKITRKIIS